MSSTSLQSWAELSVHIVQGTDAVLSFAPNLEQLAAMCGVPATMSGLRYLLQSHGQKQKLRTLVLFSKPGTTLDTLRPGDLLASVLTFELSVLGVRTGAFATDDRTATRTVIAPPGEHGVVTALASEALLRRGAHAVLTSHIVSHLDQPSAGSQLTTRGLVWGARPRCYRQTMLLADTYEDTLRLLGKKTRFHMRYYRRRLEAMFDLEFVPDVRTCMTLAEFAALNAQARYPVTSADCRARWHIADEPGGYTIGLRTRQGEWLAVVGGWRQAGTVLVDYQFNTEKYPKESVSSVMRSYLLETEVERGTRRLCIPQGTPHSMVNSFAPQHSHELLAYRRTLRFHLLRLLAKGLVNRAPGSITRLARAIVGDGRALYVVGKGMIAPSTLPDASPEHVEEMEPALS